MFSFIGAILAAIATGVMYAIWHVTGSGLVIVFFVAWFICWFLLKWGKEGDLDRAWNDFFFWTMLKALFGDGGCSCDCDCDGCSCDDCGDCS